MRRLFSEYNVFTLSRIVGLGAKPLFIYALLYLGQSDFSNLYVIVITYVQFSLFFFNSEAQQRYYKAHFSSKNSRFTKAKEFLIYGRNCTTHLILLLLPAAIFCLWMTDTVYIGISVVILAVVEKLFDECQRYLIYAKLYAEWSKIFLAKMFIPFFVCAINFLLTGSISIYVFLISYFVSVVWSSIRLKVFDCRVIKFSIRHYFKYGILRTPFILLFTLSSSNVLFFDRVIVSSRFPDSVSKYVLACNVAVFSIIFYDYFYLTKKKPELVNFSGKILFELFSRKNLFSALFPATACATIVLLLPESLLKEFFIEKYTMMFVLLAYGIYNLTMLLTVFGYWHLSHKHTSFIELGLLVSFCAMTLFSISFIDVAMIMLLYLVLRFFCYLLLIRCSKKYG